MERRYLSQPIFELEEPLPPSPPPPPPSSLESSGFNLNNKVSPSILMIIIILAIIFFISGLLHLLVRFLLRPPRRDPDEMDDVTALQGQLQQLFHLHDAGVDQSYIDTLPVFNYKAIIGVKSPFDCAVCLSEFEPEDNLRLLPKCSHAFHMECIDTWLLSHSTCPLCRANLLSDFSTHHNLSHVVLVLESGSDNSSREINPAENTNISTPRTNESRVPLSDLFQKSGEIKVKEEKNQQFLVGSGEKIVSVKLGKFRNVNGGTGECSNENNIDERRCFSMGSFAYIMDENSSLQVPIRTPIKKPSCKKPCHRAAMSECGWDSRREIIGFEAFRNLESQENGSIGVMPQIIQPTRNDIDAEDKANDQSSKRESFSISKIWLRGKEDKQPNLAAGETSRRAFSFRLPC